MKPEHIVDAIHEVAKSGKLPPQVSDALFDIAVRATRKSDDELKGRSTTDAQAAALALVTECAAFTPYDPATTDLEDIVTTANFIIRRSREIVDAQRTKS